MRRCICLLFATLLWFVGHRTGGIVAGQRADVFSSTAEMESLFNFEAKMDLALSEHAKMLTEQLEVLNRVLMKPPEGEFKTGDEVRWRQQQQQQQSRQRATDSPSSSDCNSPNTTITSCACSATSEKKSNNARGLMDEKPDEIERWNVWNNEEATRTRGAVNPLDSFALLKRLAVDIRPLQEILTSTDQAVNESVSSLTRNLWDAAAESGVKLPLSFVDLSGAAAALVRLRETYNFSIYDLFDGRIIQYEPSHGHTQDGADVEMKKRLIAFGRPLSARDMMFIGKHAFNKNLFGEAVDWLSAALKFASTEKMNSTSEDEVLPFLQTAKRVHDETLLKKGPLGPMWKTKPHLVTSAARSAYNNTELDTFFKKWNTYLNPPIFKPFNSAHEEDVVFHKLCRGEVLQTPGLQSKLKCRLLKKSSPYLLLAPAKLEEVSTYPNPHIVVFHDFLSDSTSDMMMQLAKSVGLQRSTHMDPQGKMLSSDKRTSKQVWLHREVHPLMGKVSRMIETVTGLNLRDEKSSEPFQVANYGIGGSYIPHADYTDFKTDLRGAELQAFHHIIRSRIATFMIYLSDVVAGGGTAFTVAGAVVAPKKGSAVFWWNLDTNQNGDPWTRHGACPVLVGSKWIANKWIRAHGQMFELPCLPEPRRLRAP